MSFCRMIAAMLVVGLSYAAAARGEDAFSYAGDVVDQKGQPIAGVEVTATHRAPDGKSFGYIATVKTDARGHFSIDRPQALSGASPATVAGDTIRLEFVDQGHVYARLEDLHVFTREQATKLLVTLADGRSITGRVVDAQGRPVKGAAVEIRFGEVHELRRGAASDAGGRFEFHGLPA